MKRNKLWAELFSGTYFVSENGEILSRKTNKILSDANNGHGYRIVCLQIKGTQTTKKVHRLVMEGFYGKCELEVNHLNGKKDDNSLKNLAYVTRSENQKHAYRMLPDYDLSGAKNGNAKLSERDIEEIRKLLKQNLPHKIIGQKFGVSKSTIQAISSGRNWKKKAPRKGPSTQLQFEFLN